MINKKTGKHRLLLKILLTSFYVLALSLILLLSVRGRYGNPNTTDLAELSWRDNGPFELSPERGRFALLYSLVEDKSFYFSVDLARFVLPDLGYNDGHFVSLFAPGVSYIVMPGYILGKYFSASQVGTFLTVSLFALLNTFLIYKIARNFGAGNSASVISGIVFLFATPAFAYAVNLYQHHISTFLILLSIYLITKWRNFFTLFIVWFLCAASIPIDYPNLFLMFPIGLYALQSGIKKINEKKKVKIVFSVGRILPILAVVFPLLFFFWFNLRSYGNPFQFSGTVSSSGEIDENGNPTFKDSLNLQDVQSYVDKEVHEKSAFGFFNPRQILNGLFIHLISPDRGILYFTPVALFGLIGFYFLHKKKNKFLPLFAGIIAANVILYSMWGDPWGGWAFGSRYLIPTYAILSIMVGIALANTKRVWLMLVAFYPVLLYSIGVNTLGALTTSAIPPRVQVLDLERLSGVRERYSWDRDWEFLNAGRSKSFVFQTWAHNYVDSAAYFYIIFGSISALSTIFVLSLLFKKE